MYGIGTFVIAVIGFVLLAWGIAKLLSPVSKKGPTERPTKSSRRWAVYIVLAIILSFWSGTIALFFLLILWIILKNPAGDMQAEIRNTEKSVARRVYIWLFVSPIFTVPSLIYLLFVTDSDYAASNKFVLIALTPLLWHLPLLLGLASGSIFVYRHTQQGILLIALRAFVTVVALNISQDSQGGLWLFLLGSGALWLLGSLWGWVQVNRGDCWWMEQRRDVPSALGESIPSPKIESPRLLSAEQCLEFSKGYLKRQLPSSAKEFALQAFRSGNYEIKHQAIRVLDDMNELELF